MSSLVPWQVRLLGSFSSLHRSPQLRESWRDFSRKLILSYRLGTRILGAVPRGRVLVIRASGGADGAK